MYKLDANSPPHYIDSFIFVSAQKTFQYNMYLEYYNRNALWIKRNKGDTCNQLLIKRMWL